MPDQSLERGGLKAATRLSVRLRRDNMSLRNLFPLQYVKDKFDKDVIAEEYDLSTIKELSQKAPHPVLQIGLCIWHQIVTRSLFQVDPRAMAKYVDDQDPILYKKIEELLGIQAVFDLYYANLSSTFAIF